ncbi:hypothetical protein J5N97_023233 [Dioscorea zingiberensis]|uniref:Uncharacterized protein n=1 Tax=Dioscorea zingiberensis TaxID=325984 RepID=A0A9D5CBN1_9LILI|nr:hypothetical protein J5N97_023233 [Dioscorea zingiberensis]
MKKVVLILLVFLVLMASVSAADQDTLEGDIPSKKARFIIDGKHDHQVSKKVISSYKDAIHGDSNIGESMNHIIEQVGHGRSVMVTDQQGNHPTDDPHCDEKCYCKKHPESWCKGVGK